MPKNGAMHNLGLEAQGAIEGNLKRIMVNQKLFEAIATRKCLHATYNRVRMKLAPHILYTRNDAVFISMPSRSKKSGAEPREKKLGSFKLDGLSGVAVADEAFLRRSRCSTRSTGNMPGRPCSWSNVPRA